MIRIIIGNVIGLIASLFMVYSGLVKEKRRVILMQSIQIGMATVSHLILGGITGAITNVISFTRNVLCYKGKLNTLIKILLMVVITAFSLMFNNLGLIGMMPIIATVLYTLLIDMKDIVKFKIMVIITMILWCIYEIQINLYTSAMFDIMCIITNILAICKIKKEKLKKVK